MSARRTPPTHSHVSDPDGPYWCALLDGFPVAHCTEFDLDENWVQVYVIAENKTGVCRILDTPQRRLHGRVEAVRVEEWAEIRKTRESIVIDTEHLRGDPIPGTELRMRKSS